MSAPSQPLENGLIITDGSIPALTAAWREAVCRPSGPKADRPFLWHPAGLPDGAMAAIRHAAAVCRIDHVIPGSVPSGDTAMAANVMLLAAGADAAAHNLTRIVWPVQFGIPDAPDNAPRHNRIAQAFDRALMAARLLSVDTPSGIIIETPFLDLTDEQLLDLAADLDAPIGSAWWCEVVTDPKQPPCGKCAGCLRWQGAMKRAGIVPAIAQVPAGFYEQKPTNIRATA